MIELEVYAAGVRDMKVILELDHVLEGIPGLRYKIDRNHDIVYFEVDQPKFNVQEILSAFERLGLKPRVVGEVPQELNKKKTQLLH
ncbi:MAG: hypothetical protein WCH57_12230 [Verrucomicrobiota bacterium]